MHAVKTMEEQKSGTLRPDPADQHVVSEAQFEIILRLLGNAILPYPLGRRADGALIRGDTFEALSQSQRAMIGARIPAVGKGSVKAQKDRGLPSSFEIAALFGLVGRTYLTSARRLLREATAFEVAKADAGQMGITRAAERLGTMSAKDRVNHINAPIGARSGTLERIARQREDAVLWEQLRKALSNISNMPAAADMVKLARSNNMRAKFIDTEIIKATVWLMEFEDGWKRGNAD